MYAYIIYRNINIIESDIVFYLNDDFNKVVCEKHPVRRQHDRITNNNPTKALYIDEHKNTSISKIDVLTIFRLSKWSRSTYSVIFAIYYSQRLYIVCINKCDKYTILCIPIERNNRPCGWEHAMMYAG